MNRLLIPVAVLVCLALAPVSFAQEHHPVSKTQISFSEPVVVGTTTLSPGRYRFECKRIEGQHVMIITRTETAKEAARVPCTPATLDAKVVQTEYRSVLRGDVRVLTEIRINGESVAHRLSSTN